MGRRTIAIIVAVVLALAAAGLVWWYTSSVKTETKTQEETTVVLVAREEIPARTTGEAAVENRLVEIQTVPKKYAVAGVLASEAQLKGRVFEAGVTKGQQIVAGQLGTPETQSLSFQIEKGMRAVSVPVDREKAVGGLIQEGDRVDVLATFNFDILSQGNVNLGPLLSPEERDRILKDTGIDLDASKGSMTRTLLQQVEVLKIDALISAGGGGGGLGGGTDQGVPDNPVIVLMVKSEEAERLVFAQQQGNVWFALIPAEDKEKAPAIGRTLINEYR